MSQSGEAFGEERLLAWAARQSNRPAAEVQQSLLDAVTAFCGARRQPDDLTVLVARFE